MQTVAIGNTGVFSAHALSFVKALSRKIFFILVALHVNPPLICFNASLLQSSVAMPSPPLALAQTFLLLAQTLLLLEPFVSLCNLY